MDVEKHLRRAAELLREEYVRFNQGEFTSELYTKLDFPVQGTPGRGAMSAGRFRAAGSALTSRNLRGDQIPLAQFEEELSQLRRKQLARQKGGTSELRRIAELVELLEGEQAAIEWWYRAAHAGDPLAALTVQDLEKNQGEGRSSSEVESCQTDVVSRPKFEKDLEEGR
uniref:hypothetical protein n=1 Tax=Streptosporangium sp. CA-256172 TaxID=3240076 RepID=UPI003F494283